MSSRGEKQLGKAIIITGTSTGIGAAVLQQLSQHSNYTIFSVSRRPLSLPLRDFQITQLDDNSTQYYHTLRNTTLYHYQADLSLLDSPTNFFHFIQKFAQQHSITPIHALLLNAGTVEPLGPLSTLPFSDFQRYSTNHSLI